MKNLDKLPEWAAYNEERKRIEVDPAVVYPMYLKELGMEATQASLECARHCMNRDLLEITGPGIALYIKKDDSFKLSNFSPGERLDARAEHARLCRQRAGL